MMTLTLNKIRAIKASIFEDKRIGNCSNNGISARYNEVLVLHPEGNIKLDPDDLPENLVLILSKILPDGSEYIYARPYNDNGRWHMAGGSFIYSCDSRFTDYSKYPISLHDRCEF